MKKFKLINLDLKSFPTNLDGNKSGAIKGGFKAADHTEARGCTTSMMSACC